MPWLGDGQWVDTDNEARQIVRGDMPYGPHGHHTKARKRQQERKRARKVKRFEQEQGT